MKSREKNHLKKKKKKMRFYKISHKYINFHEKSIFNLFKNIYYFL